MKKKLFITGAQGQLGQAVLDLFQGQYHIFGVDLLREPPKQAVQYATVDITDESRLAKLIADIRPDVILNLAAMTNVDNCERQPEFAHKINVETVNHLLTHSLDAKFIHISSDYIFDGENGPYTETDPVNPINVYGKNKLESESLVKSYSGSWCIIRTNVVFDYTNFTTASFVKWVVDSLSKNTPINVVDDQWNNPTWTVSMAHALKAVVDQDATGVYNYSGKDWLNRFDFAKMVAAVFDLDPNLISPISTVELDQPAKRPLKSGLITTKIENKLGVKCDALDVCLKQIRDRMN